MAQSLWRVPTAILTGDALRSWPTGCWPPSPHLARRWVSDALVKVVARQGAFMVFEHRTAVDLGECVAMAAGKTAALVDCACALGA